MPMMNCHKCGKYVSTHAGYCCRCGARLDQHASDLRYARIARIRSILTAAGTIAAAIVTAWMLYALLKM